jgi:hypothetical protein
MAGCCSTTILRFAACLRFDGLRMAIATHLCKCITSCAQQMHVELAILFLAHSTSIIFWAACKRCCA